MNIKVLNSLKTECILVQITPREKQQQQHLNTKHIEASHELSHSSSLIPNEQSQTNSMESFVHIAPSQTITIPMLLSSISNIFYLSVHIMNGLNNHNLSCIANQTPIDCNFIEILRNGSGEIILKYKTIYNCLAFEKLLSLNIPKYLCINMINNGWDDISFWKDIKNQDLIKMGFKKGHILKFMKYLNAKSNNFRCLFIKWGLPIYLYENMKFMGWNDIKLWHKINDDDLNKMQFKPGHVATFKNHIIDNQHIQEFEEMMKETLEIRKNSIITVQTINTSSMNESEFKESEFKDYEPLLSSSTLPLPSATEHEFATTDDDEDAVNDQETMNENSTSQVKESDIMPTLECEIKHVTFESVMVVFKEQDLKLIEQNTMKYVMDLRLNDDDGDGWNNLCEIKHDKNQYLINKLQSKREYALRVRCIYNDNDMSNICMTMKFKTDTMMTLEFDQDEEKRGDNLVFISDLIVKSTSTDTWSTCIFNMEISGHICDIFFIEYKIISFGNHRGSNFFIGYFINNDYKNINWNQQLGIGQNKNKSIGIHIGHKHFDFYDINNNDKQTLKYEADENFKIGDTFKLKYDFKDCKFELCHNNDTIEIFELKTKIIIPSLSIVFEGQEIEISDWSMV